MLSRGEAQWTKLAAELAKLKRSGRTLYIFDEPTTGLHFADIDRLIECIQRMVNAGNTAVVIEHHMQAMKQADHVIDLGPEGGHRGGKVVFCGTPEALAQCESSHTGRFRRAHIVSP